MTKVCIHWQKIFWLNNALEIMFLFQVRMSSLRVEFCYMNNDREILDKSQNLTICNEYPIWQFTSFMKHWSMMVEAGLWLLFSSLDTNFR
jgi:type III secretory pathway component EscU